MYRPRQYLENKTQKYSKSFNRATLSRMSDEEILRYYVYLKRNQYSKQNVSLLMKLNDYLLKNDKLYIIDNYEYKLYKLKNQEVYL